MSFGFCFCPERMAQEFGTGSLEVGEQFPAWHRKTNIGLRKQMISS